MKKVYLPRLSALLLAALLLLLPSFAAAEIEITLQNSFIEHYKDRATIDVNYIVDKAHSRPNPPAKDGDMHVAGRASEVGLPIVAEIMNAKHQPEAVKLVHRVEGTGQSVRLSGAWRLWTEHGGSSQQVQGEPLQPFDTTNPDHVFELHPITRIEHLTLLDSFVPIDGFQPKDAATAFAAYENLRSRITVNRNNTTTITTSMGGYNYVEFVIELHGDQKEVADGRFVMASVHSVDGELLVRNRRMVFVAGTPPELKVKPLQKGDRLHVLGIPRIDLALVSWRARNAGHRPEVLTWNLPYEILIVGVYDDNE